MAKDAPDYLACQARHAAVVNAYRAARQAAVDFNAGVEHSGQ